MVRDNNGDDWIQRVVFLQERSRGEPFRGTCKQHADSDMVEGENGTFYVPSGYFTYLASVALSTAYARAIETGSAPIVACLEGDMSRPIPEKDVTFIDVGDRAGIENLVGFHKAHAAMLTEVARNLFDEPTLYRFLDDYLRKNTAAD